MMDSKGCERRRTWSVPMYYFVIDLEGRRETTKPLSGWSVSRPCCWPTWFRNFFLSAMADIHH